MIDKALQKIIPGAQVSAGDLTKPMPSESGGGLWWE